ncbi:hypothetical protein ACIQVL_48800 [Streptomyces sp. NPDC090499]
MPLSTTPGLLAMAGLLCAAVAGVCFVGFAITAVHTLTRHRNTEQP